MDEIRVLITELADALAEAGEFELADRASAARWDDDATLAEFIASDRVWGGAGSIADQSRGAGRDAQRVKVEAALISLGHRQMALGIADARTRSSVEAFEQWADEDV